MREIPDAAVYPQFIPAQIPARYAPAAHFPDGFRLSPAVHNRPAGIRGYERTPLGLKLTLNTNARMGIPSFTHETPMDLYSPAEATESTLFLRVELWDESTFRVIFSGEETVHDPFGKLPPDARMLVGSPKEIPFTLEQAPDALLLKTGKMQLRIDMATAAISATDAQGNCFFSQRRENFQTADIQDLSLTRLGEDFACFEALDLEADEDIYGLGERFDSLTRNGRQVDFHNKDAVGTTSPRTYVNIPFYISSRGYGLFLNAGCRIDWQVGTRDASALQFAVYDGQMDYFVIGGSTPAQILRGYWDLTGSAQLPPLWSFGLWMSRNSYTSWEVVDDIAGQIRSQDIPCDVLHLDTAWFARDWDCDLKFSEERFPNPKEKIAGYKDQGFHISLWQYNFIPPNADNTHYLEAVERGYLSQTEDGSPYQLPECCQGAWTRDVTVDFSNPEARDWYGAKIADLIRLGAGAIKTDFGEGIAEEARYHSMEGKHFHNLYSLVYNRTVFEACKSVSGENLVWARSGTAGSQRYPIHWGGDSQCTFDALAATLRGALSIGISGIPYFSHDIGGFIGLPTDELYIRWAQLGLFSSHSRCHGAGDHTFREPWRFSEEACGIFRFYDKLRYRLMPYIYAEAEKCTKTALPMMRALYLAYPDDRNVRHIDDEYLFGDSLLIAPVLKPLARTKLRQLYLPEGVWFDYFTRERIESRGQWFSREVDLATMPIYVKAGTRLCYREDSPSLATGMGEIVKEELWV